MKKTFSFLLLSFSVFVMMGSGLVMAAQGAGGTVGGAGGGNPAPNSIPIKFPNPFNDKVGNSLFGLVKAIVNNIVLPVGGVLCVLAFIYAGFMYVMAQGNSTKLEEANRALLYAAIGTAVLLGAWVLANTVCQTIQLLGGPECPSFK